MIHLNGHLLCAIDTETTGLDYLKNDIVEIAVVPLDFNLEPDYNYIPFDIRMSPTNYDNIDYSVISKKKLAYYEKEGYNPLIAADLFTEWFERLRLPDKCRIVPLAHNWIFDSDFIREWLGPSSYNLYFDSRHRDLMQVSLFLNDAADHQAERCPFPKNKLSYVLSQLDIEVDHDQLHTAFYDAIKTAEGYKKLCQRCKFL